MIIKPLTEKNYPEIEEIWWKSVQATHSFIKKEDLSYIKSLFPSFLVGVKLWGIFQNNKIAGFMGIYEKELVMIFLDPKFLRKGFGSELIKKAIKEGVTRTEVNEANIDAIKFYEKHNFSLSKKQEKDALGLPYPIWEMELRK